MNISNVVVGCDAVRVAGFDDSQAEIFTDNPLNGIYWVTSQSGEMQKAWHKYAYWKRVNSTRDMHVLYWCGRGGNILDE